MHSKGINVPKIDVNLNRCYLQEKSQKALPGATTDVANGDPGEVWTTVIELPTAMVNSLQTMITSSQPQCTMGNVLVQNGLTTNQVTHHLTSLSHAHTVH